MTKGTRSTTEGDQGNQEIGDWSGPPACGILDSMTRKHGTARSEAAEIKRMGARPQANSGRGKINKGDAVIDDYWLCDVKEYPKGFTVSLEAWAKICTDAIRAGNLEPTLNIVLGEGNQRVRLFVLSEDEMNEYRRLRALHYGE